MAFSKFISKAELLTMTAEAQATYATDVATFIAQCKALGKISISATITGINPYFEKDGKEFSAIMIEEPELKKDEAIFKPFIPKTLVLPLAMADKIAVSHNFESFEELAMLIQTDSDKGTADFDIFLAVEGESYGKGNYEITHVRTENIAVSLAEYTLEKLQHITLNALQANMLRRLQTKGKKSSPKPSETDNLDVPF